MRKTILIIPLLLITSFAWAWPPIPRAIANGKGTYFQSKERSEFLWGVLQSLTKKENIYILISMPVSEFDLKKLESEFELFLRDEGSIVLRIRINAPKKQSQEITKVVADKITALCPEFNFDIDHAKYVPRP